MPLFEIDWHSFTGYSGVPTTLEIDIVPAQTGVQAWLNGVDGGGLVFVGIDSYRRRLSSGADQPIEFPMAVRKLLPSRRGGTAPIRLRPVCWGRAVPPGSMIWNATRRA